MTVYSFHSHLADAIQLSAFIMEITGLSWPSVIGHLADAIQVSAFIMETTGLSWPNVIGVGKHKSNYNSGRWVCIRLNGKAQIS